MFKLKIINKPKMIKMKCNIEFPDVILANLQEKEVVPTKEKQEIVPDKNYDGLSKVIVDKIPDEYIIPTGNIEIIENGIYNVREKETANVNVPEKVLGTKTITSNGIYKASDDNLDGYSEVEVATSGVDINNYFEINYTGNEYFRFIKRIPTNTIINAKNCDYMFSSCSRLQEIPLLDTSNVTSMIYMFSNCPLLPTIPLLDTSKVTNMGYMFKGCNNLTSIPQLDTSKVTSMNYMFSDCVVLTTIPELYTSEVTNMSSVFYGCSSLTTIPNFDMSKVNRIGSAFDGCAKLTNVGRFENLGMAFSTTQSANFPHYKLNLSACTNLTYDSLMNIINSLYDIATLGVKSQQLIVGSTNLAKLTAEEIAIATSKGWTVS